ncbi:MAG: hypothetical protein ABIZ49_08300 [Opitutaceae bacterium]
MDAAQRSIANAVQVFFTDGTKTERIEVHFPIGHRCRRKEGIPILQQKATSAFTTRFEAGKSAELTSLFTSRSELERKPAAEFCAQLSL